MKPDDAKTRLILETNDNRYIWESPYADANMDEILNALYGLCVGATWQPETVIKCMKEFADEHSYIIKEENEGDEPKPHFYS